MTTHPAIYQAITIWQPWATLIAIGAKPYEFRRWAAPKRLVGQRIAIHAGARPVKKAEVADLILRIRNEDGFGTGLVADRALELLERVHTSPGILPLSSVLCTAILGTPRKPLELFRGKIEDSDRIDHQIWAWPLRDIEVLEPCQTVHQQQRRDRLARARGYLARIEAGETAAEIARQEGISRERVYQIAGELRPRRRLNADWTDDLVAELRRLKAEGLSESEIARRLGVSKHAVRGKVYRMDLMDLAALRALAASP